MARLYKRGRIWWADYYQNGKRTRAPLDPDKRIAEHKLANIIKHLHDGRYGTGARNLSWEAFKWKYLDYARGNKAKGTVKRDTAALRALEGYYIPKQISEVTPELLERWQGKRREKGMRPPTINRDLRAIKTMMRKAESWGHIQIQNWRGVKRLKEARGRLLFYTPAELTGLLVRCHGTWRTIALLGARAGLRRGEIHNLAWEDVDFARQRLHVCPKPGWTPKDYEQRWVPIPDDLAQHLKSLERDGPWVLGEGRPSLEVLSVYFRRLAHAAGLKGSVHTLRHTYASHLAQAGVPILTISKLLGHASVRTTEIYAHLAPDNLGEAVAMLPKI